MTRRGFLFSFAAGIAATTALLGLTRADDPFAAKVVGLSDPPMNAVLITPDDSNNLATTCRCFLAGSDGNVKVTTAGGQTLLLTGLKSGVVYPFRCQRIWSTTTTVTNIVVWY